MYALMYIILKDNIKNDKQLNKILCIGLCIETILLITYRLNLYYIGREVYFSDAETYWEKTLELIKYGTTSGYNPLYYKICYLIQKTSPFIWAGWNNIFNIACINLTLTIILKNNISNNNGKNYKWIVFAIMYNPFIIYGLMRNLKDALFTLMIYIVAITYYGLCKTKKITNKIIFVIIIILFSYLFSIIRPWGFIIPICVILLYIIELIKKYMQNNKKNSDKKEKLYFIIGMFIIIITIPTICYLFPTITRDIKIWFPIVKDLFLKKDIITIIIGIVKLCMAPGPLRSLLGMKYFEHYTISGNIMCCIGSLMWWVSLIIIGANLSSQAKAIKRIKDNHFVILLLITTIIYILMYVNQYDGMVEIRLRSSLYILAYSIFFNVYDVIKFNDNRKRYLISMIIGTIFFSAVTFIGMK